LGQTSIVLKGAAGEIFEISAPFAHRLDHDDDACVRERAADPLHRPRIDSELFGNHTHTGPARSGQGLTDSFFECWSNRWAIVNFRFSISRK